MHHVYNAHGTHEFDTIPEVISFLRTLQANHRVRVELGTIGKRGWAESFPIEGTALGVADWLAVRH
ncbi:MAG: hypothetical protein WBA46_00175 [Thermomicrobiales bacterium]